LRSLARIALDVALDREDQLLHRRVLVAVADDTGLTSCARRASQSGCPDDG
jgi:hypothetical protein